jgi:hypothetical protein
MTPLLASSASPTGKRVTSHSPPTNGGHTCWRDHGTVEPLDDLAFEYYKSRHPDVTISMISCGMD